MAAQQAQQAQHSSTAALQARQQLGAVAQSAATHERVTYRSRWVALKEVVGSLSPGAPSWTTLEPEAAADELVGLEIDQVVIGARLHRGRDCRGQGRAGQGAAAARRR